MIVIIAVLFFYSWVTGNNYLSVKNDNLPSEERNEEFSYLSHGSLQDQIGERKCPIRFLNRFQDNCP